MLAPDPALRQFIADARGNPGIVGAATGLCKAWSERMRYVNGFFCVVLTLFALAQYNDPDAPVWFLIYAIPAAWAGFAAFRPDLLRPSAQTLAAYAACLAAAVLGSLYLWPSLPANWIHVEEEREALGLIIAALALALVGIAWWLEQRWQPNAAR
jgi:Transmembrane family 220, helix